MPAAVVRRGSRRGFAAMSPEKQREIASLGGKAAHAQGNAHEFSRDEAIAAGKRGGAITQRKRAEAKNKPPVGEKGLPR
ncbi:MAG: KGG domain-containing protein [Patescibacteria group bacterium]